MVTAGKGTHCANLVLTMPGFGALAMMTSVQSPVRGRRFVGSEDSIGSAQPGLTLVVAFLPFDGENNSSLSG